MTEIISIRDDLYKRLKSMKNDQDIRSFSDAIDFLFQKWSEYEKYYIKTELQK